MVREAQFARLAGLALAVAASCTMEPTSTREGSVAGSSGPPESLATAVELAATQPSIAEVLAPRADGLVRRGAALRYAGRAAGGSIEVRLAETADGGVEITPWLGETHRLALVPEGATRS